MRFVFTDTGTSDRQRDVSSSSPSSSLHDFISLNKVYRVDFSTLHKTLEILDDHLGILAVGRWSMSCL